MSGKSSTRWMPEGDLGHTAANQQRLESRSAFLEAARAGEIMEAECLMCDCATMQLRISLPGGIIGIMPKEEVCWQADGGETKDIAVITRVGKPVQFRVLSVTENECGETVARLSRRIVQQACADDYVSRLTCGDIIPARVTHLEAFGAFCDIGCGIVSLLTVDRISVSRITHPSDRFRVGDRLSVLVSSIEENGRIYLSHRELLGTWAENASLFSAGQTVRGIVRSVESYGIFVELTPNLAGLAELTDGVQPGDACSVYIKSILPERMKVKLVLIDTCGKAETAPCRYWIDPAETKHLDRWLYSPVGARKTVESSFGALSVLP